MSSKFPKIHFPYPPCIYKIFQTGMKVQVRMAPKKFLCGHASQDSGLGDRLCLWQHGWAKTILRRGRINFEK